MVVRILVVRRSNSQYAAMLTIIRYKVSHTNIENVRTMYHSLRFSSKEIAMVAGLVIDTID